MTIMEIVYIKMVYLSHRIKIFLYHSLKIRGNEIKEDGAKGTDLKILF